MTGSRAVPRKSPIQRRIVRWTPTNARKALERTPRGMMRNPAPHLVSHFAAAMRAGRWVAGVGTIQLTPEGYVLDGQHRLRALVRAGKAIRMWTVRTPELLTVQRGGHLGGGA